MPTLATWTWTFEVPKDWTDAQIERALARLEVHEEKVDNLVRQMAGTVDPLIKVKAEA